MVFLSDRSTLALYLQQAFKGPLLRALHPSPMSQKSCFLEWQKTCNDFLPFLTLENKSSELDKIRRIAVDAIRVVFQVT